MMKLSMNWTKSRSDVMNAVSMDLTSTAITIDPQEAQMELKEF